MKKEVRIFFTALMFLTRIPVPSFTDHAPDYLEKSTRYFPLIGGLVGSISVAVLLLFHQFYSTELSVLASIITGLLTTGAFHEDGFADVCDAFGGGWTQEKILAIMKDSRLGTYGVAGLVMILAAKFLLLKELADLLLDLDHGWAMLLGIVLLAHSWSRMMSVLTIQISQYVSPEEKAKSKPLASSKLGYGAFLFAFIFAVLPFFILPAMALWVIIPTLLLTWLVKRYFEKWIHGYTGDCLGAIQQVNELLIYLILLGIWKFI